MAQRELTPQLALLEEAVTVLFCEVDDIYYRLNPKGRSYETLKELSDSEVITLGIGITPVSRFFRESDEPHPGSRPGSKVSFQAAEAYSTRCLNKSNFPRPYIERLMNLSLFTRPSVCP